MWMACSEQEEIAEVIGAPRQTVADKIAEKNDVAIFGKTDQAAANHARDFESSATVRGLFVCVFYSWCGRVGVLSNPFLSDAF